MQQARFGLSVFVVNIIKVIFDIKPRLHEGRRSPAINLALPLIFFNLRRWNLSKLSLFVKLPCRLFKTWKNRGYQGSFLAICNFVFSSSISNLVFWFLLSTCSEGRAQICSTLQQILGKRDKSVCFACLVLRPRPDLTRSKNPILRVSRSYFNFRHSFWLTIAC